MSRGRCPVEHHAGAVEVTLETSSSTDALSANDGWAALGRDQVLCRQILVLHRQHRFCCAVETGTWKGHTTVALATMFPRVYTIEVDRQRYEANRPRFAAYNNIVAVLGDSPRMLVDLMDTFEFPLFALLDAHWGEKWPLRDELKILLSVRRPKLVAIHDFKVPGREFGYDRYGDQECSLDYVADLLPHNECKYTFNSYVAPQSERRGVLFIEHLLYPSSTP